MLNEKYSFKDFLDKSFRTIPVSEFNNTEIVGSCFYQQNKPNCKIFPDNMIGVTFKRCNLDNVYIPIGNIIISEDWEKCTHKNIKVQNDLSDWILDNTLKPVEPMNKKSRLAEGKSIDPKDIPIENIREEIINKSEWDKTYDKSIFPDKSWFREIPIITKTETNDVVAEVSNDEWNLVTSKDYFMFFDEEPELLGTHTAIKKVFQRDIEGKIVRNEKLRPISVGTKEVMILKLKGKSTKYTIRGKAWLYRGQEEE